MRKALILIGIAVFCVGFGKCGKSADQTLREKLPIAIPSPLPVSQTYLTPKGVLVGGNFAVAESDLSAFLNDVDAGIERTLNVTARLGYSQWRDYAQNTIVYERPTSFSLDDGCPTLNLKSGQKIAGTVIGVGDIVINPPFIYIAYAAVNSEACRTFRRNAVAYELEHIQAWFNDRDLFWQKTGANDVHPIYSENSIINNNPKTQQGREVLLYDWQEYRKGIYERH